jgi:hypothetical protein
VTHPAALRARQQAIDNLADHERREHAVLTRRIDQPHEPQRSRRAGSGWPNVFSALPVAKDVFEKRPK